MGLSAKLVSGQKKSVETDQAATLVSGCATRARYLDCRLGRLDLFELGNGWRLADTRA
jgi:hypothetical protein